MKKMIHETPVAPSSRVLQFRGPGRSSPTNVPIVLSSPMGDGEDVVEGFVEGGGKVEEGRAVEGGGVAGDADDVADGGSDDDDEEEEEEEEDVARVSALPSLFHSVPLLSKETLTAAALMT